MVLVKESIDFLLVDRRIADLPKLLEVFKGVSLILMAPPSRAGLTGTLDAAARLQKPIHPDRFYAALARALEPFPPIQTVLKAPLQQVEEFKWPAAEVDSLPPQPLSADEHQPTNELRILITEDNPANQRVAQLMLSRLGYQADIAGDGYRALKFFESSFYDVVLMDMQMPGIDGLETTRLIRSAQADGRQPYIIAMTASVMRGDRERCLEAGMNDYISKPVKFEELARALKDCQNFLDGKKPSAGETAVQVSSAGIRLSSGSSRSIPPSSPSQVITTDQKETMRLDRSRLENLMSYLGTGDGGSIQEVIDLFIENTQILIDQLEVNISSLDLASLQRTAHTIKSASANVGAVALSECARNLEEQVRDLYNDQPNGNTPLLTPQIVLDFAVSIDLIRHEYKRTSQEYIKAGL